MSSCDSVRKQLTAWVDGELGRRQRERIRRHLQSCPDCRAEADSIRIAVQRQQHGLRRVSGASGTDVAAMYRSLQRRLADTPHYRAGWSARVTATRLVSALTAAAAAMTITWMAGGMDAILIPLGLETPPPALTGRADLFKDYPVIQYLDVLETLEETESAPATGAGRSSLG
jgi:anti-sigma factor RsiW